MGIVRADRVLSEHVRTEVDPAGVSVVSTNLDRPVVIHPVTRDDGRRLAGVDDGGWGHVRWREVLCDDDS